MTNVLSADTERAPAGRRGPEPAGTIVVCSSCRYPGDPAEMWSRPGSALADATRKAAESSAVEVRPVTCLGNWKRGLSAAILRAGSWSYVLGELDTESVADLIAGMDAAEGKVAFAAAGSAPRPAPSDVGGPAARRRGRQGAGDRGIVTGTLATIEAAVAGQEIDRTAIVFVGRGLAATSFRESALYDATYQRRFRGREDRP